MSSAKHTNTQFNTMTSKFTKSLALFVLGCSTAVAQTGKKATFARPDLSSSQEESVIVNKRGCATIAPDAQWESQFQQLIANFKAEQKNNSVQANYTIPVIIHIIHGGQAVGTYPNISDAQANSQITVLNNDFAGIGLNASTYGTGKFSAYATAAGVPAANKDAAGGIKISNFNINFCLATIDKNGNAMATPGIEHINYNTFTLTPGITDKNPAGASNGDPTNSFNTTNFMNYMNNLCKPQTIWDPTKYLNIWVTDVPATLNGLLGFATFPAGSTLTGLPGGLGTATTDGLWCWGKAFGTTGTLQAGVNKGRTSTHEIGHWLGLRHIWGDGACATDYCLDTPPASADNAGSPTYPLNPNSCTNPTGTNNTTPNGANGEMFMNFMDYTNDVAMYMFTEDQRTRAQTTMANGTYRKFLGTHGLCSVGSPTPATAAFTMTNAACNGSVVTINNTTIGNPTPTYTWSASPATGVVFSPNANSANPTITFANNGSYVVTLAAQSGTTAVSTKTNAITISTCTVAAVCSKTVATTASSDTLYVGRAGADTQNAGCSPNAGYVFGSNCYQDKEKAAFFASSLWSNVSAPAMVTGAVVVFYKEGTKGTTGTASRAVNLKMYNGTLAAGPTGTASPVATATANLGLISAATATNNIGYLAGDPSVTYAANVAIPYKYTFSAPVSAPAAGFFLSVVTPTTAGDTAAIFNDFNSATGNSWELWSDNSWHDMNTAWGGLTNNMAIFPLITCSTKLTDYNSLSNNVSVIPNPSNGLFNVVIALPTVQDIKIEVTNMLGQSVYTNSMKSFNTGVIPVDLSDNTNGVYFLTVTNGTEKNVQRIVLTK